MKEISIIEENYQRLAREELLNQKVKLLEWAMQLCYTGSTPSMIRKELHNKLVEITGKGQKA